MSHQAAALPRPAGKPRTRPGSPGVLPGQRPPGPPGRGCPPSQPVTVLLSPLPCDTPRLGCPGSICTTPTPKREEGTEAWRKPGESDEEHQGKQLRLRQARKEPGVAEARGPAGPQARWGHRQAEAGGGEAAGQGPRPPAPLAKAARQPPPGETPPEHSGRRRSAQGDACPASTRRLGAPPAAGQVPVPRTLRSPLPSRPSAAHKLSRSGPAPLPPHAAGGAAAAATNGAARRSPATNERRREAGPTAAPAARGAPRQRWLGRPDCQDPPAPRPPGSLAAPLTEQPGSACSRRGRPAPAPPRLLRRLESGAAPALAARA